MTNRNRQNTQKPPERPRDADHPGDFVGHNARLSPERAGLQAVGRTFGVQSLRGSVGPGVGVEVARKMFHLAPSGGRAGAGGAAVALAVQNLGLYR